MFKNNPKKEPLAQPSNSSNIVASDTVVEGTIKAAGNLRIEGKVLGDIITNARIVLSEAAYVEGNIQARDAEVAGTMQGTLQLTELLTLKATALIKGDIVTPKLVFEHGACFNGSCKMPDKQAKAPVATGTPLKKDEKNEGKNLQSA